MLNQSMNTETQLIIFAIVAMVGLTAVLAIEIVPLSKQAEAKGCANANAPGGGSIAYNASKGRCFQS